MSRPPPNETPISALNASLSPFGVIDFVDNHCLSQPAAGPGVGVPVTTGVVGGPPAYLEAHGIRYVPSAALEAALEPAADSPEPVTIKAKVGPEKVSQRELDSRVDDRIRKFMADKRGLAASSEDKIRALREDIEASRGEPRRRAALYGEDDEAMLSRVKALQRDIRDLEERRYSRDLDSGVRRSRAEAYDDEDDARRPRAFVEDDDDAEQPGRKYAPMRAEAKLASESREERLRALRAECEEAAAAAKARVAASAAPVSAEAGKQAARAKKVDY